MSKLIALLLLIVGLINFAPILGMISADRLAQAYSVEISSKDLEILLRHRALLFGIVGGFILFSVFVPTYQGAAMIMGGVSMIGYLVFMWQVGGYNEALGKVMVVDIVGIVCLLGAAVLKYGLKG